MSTSPFLFADLMSAETQTTIRARLAAALLAAGQPTSSWAPSSAGGVENLRLDMVSAGLAQWMAKRYAAAVRGRLLLLAQNDPQTGYFLSYLGRKNYQLPLQGATSTIQNIALSAGANAAAADYSDGQLWVRSPATGNRYRLTLPVGETVHVAPSMTVFAPFQAENPGSAYADPPGTITQMVTAKAGLSCSNQAATSYVPTTSTGASTGTVTGAVNPLAPVGYSVIRVRIDISGEIGTGSFSWSIDGGLTWFNGGAIPATFAVPFGLGGVLTFGAGGVTPSFVQGSIFSLIVDSAILQRGRDAESPADYAARCSNRWPALSLVPVKGTIDLWAKIASPEVTKVFSQADPNTPGGILVTISSQSGPATPAAQQAVQAFITARLGFKGIPAPTSPTVPGSQSPEETVQTSAANVYPVAVAATVYVPRAQIPAAMAGADEPWQQYIDGLPIGGDPNAIVKREFLLDLLGDLGAQDVQGLTMNNSGGDLVIPPLLEAQVAPGTSLLTGLNWVPV